MGSEKAEPEERSTRRAPEEKAAAPDRVHMEKHIGTPVQEQGFNIKKTAFVVTGTVPQIQTAVDAQYNNIGTPVQEQGFNIKKTAFVTGTVLHIQTAVDALEK